MSGTELDQELRRAYDKPQDHADFAKLAFYENFPTQVPLLHDFAHRNAETIAKEAEELVNSTLSDEMWKMSLKIRNHLARGLHLVFNFPRLVQCLREAEEAYLEDTDFDILSEAKRTQKRDETRALIDLVIHMC